MSNAREYEPELGQAIFGQPHQQYEASELCIAALAAIDEELCRQMWNKNQEEYASPFQNNGGSFVNHTFELYAYSWDDTVEQPYNFKWRDVEISWYKHMRRGTTVNIDLSNDTIAEMLTDCLESLSSVYTEEAE